MNFTQIPGQLCFQHFLLADFFFPLLSFRVRFVFAIFSTTVFGSPNLP